MAAGSISVDDVRAALRREREARIGAREKLEEQSGVDQSTIYRAEQDPSYFFGIDTFIKLVNALPDLTLSGFFLHIEHLKSGVTIDDDGAASVANPITQGGLDERSRSVRTPDALALADLRAFVLRLSAALAAAVEDVPATDQSDASARDEQTGAA